LGSGGREDQDLEKTKKREGGGKKFPIGRKRKNRVKSLTYVKGEKNCKEVYGRPEEKTESICVL